MSHGIHSLTHKLAVSLSLFLILIRLYENFSWYRFGFFLFYRLLLLAPCMGLLHQHRRRSRRRRLLSSWCCCCCSSHLLTSRCVHACKVICFSMCLIRITVAATFTHSRRNFNFNSGCTGCLHCVMWTIHSSSSGARGVRFLALSILCRCGRYKILYLNCICNYLME